MKTKRMTSSFVSFCIQNSLFLCASEYVADIGSVPKQIVTLPYSQQYASKVCNSFGRIITILDVGNFLGLRDAADDLTDKNIIILKSDRKVGLLVDKIVSLDWINSSKHIQPTLGASRWVQNFYTCNTTDNIVMELNIPAILSQT